MAQIPVLLDLTGADSDVAKRILDFSSGVVFGLGSGMHRVDPMSSCWRRSAPRWTEEAVGTVPRS